MTEDRETLILDMLKNIQSPLGRIELDISEIKSRLGNVAVSLSQQGLQLAELHGRRILPTSGCPGSSRALI